MSLPDYITQINIESVYFESSSVRPILLFNVKCDCNREKPFEIFYVEGKLSFQNKIIGFLKRMPDVNDINLNINTLAKRDKRWVQLYIELDDYLSLKIEEMRTQYSLSEGVRFEFELIFHVLRESPRGGLNCEIVCDRRNFSNTISQSEWLKDFYPNLFQEKKILLELTSLDDIQISDQHFQTIRSKLSKSDNHFRKGDYEEAFETAREIVEIFYKEKSINDSLRNLLLKYKHGEDGINEFQLALKHFFEYLSKPLHSIDKQNQVRVPADYRKEDAEFAYSFAYTLTNLYYQKLNR